MSFLFTKRIDSIYQPVAHPIRLDIVAFVFSVSLTYETSLQVAARPPSRSLLTTRYSNSDLWLDRRISSAILSCSASSFSSTFFSFRSNDPAMMRRVMGSSLSISLDIAASASCKPFTVDRLPALRRNFDSTCDAGQRTTTKKKNLLSLT